MIKRNVMLFVLIASGCLAMQTHAGSVESLRGGSELDETSTQPVKISYPKEGESIDRAYVQQPPLVPHRVDGYAVNLKKNKCMDCHSWENHKEEEAPKVSVSHFQSRDGEMLSELSGSRYFCTQCHVPQANAQPLVSNTFKPVSSK